MSGQKIYTKKMLINDVFSMNAAARYDNVPEPGGTVVPLPISNNPSKDKAMDSYYYVADSHGSIKWIFPIDSSYPLFLSLHNSPTLRAYLYKRFVRMAFKLGLKKLVVSGTMKLDNKQTKPLRSILEKIEHDDFAIYTGKAIERRKSVIALGKENKTTHFIKLAHSKEAEDEIENEELALMILEQNRFKHWEHSEVMDMTEPSSIVLNNIKPKRAKSQIFLGNLHLKMLVELYEKFYHRSDIKNLSYYQEIQHNLKNIHGIIGDTQIGSDSLSYKIAKKLQEVFERIPSDFSVKVSFTHNDFTPWNMYLASNKLYVYDWDTAKQQMPILHDLFHFVYHSGIFLQKATVNKIQQQINQALQAAPMKEYTRKYRVNNAFHHQLYLLYTASRSLKRHLTNPEKNSSDQKVLKVCHEALKQLEV